MKTLIASLLLALPCAAQEFGKPVRLEAGGKPIDTEVGHAAPYVYDFNHDGKFDLLVGQFGQGKLKIFRNTGTNEAPVFADSTFFRAGGQDATVPAG